MNHTDLKLSLYYLVCKFLHFTFNIKDDLKALEIKLCIFSRYPSLPQTILSILNYASVCIYLRLLDNEIDDTATATVVYHSRFIELAEILYELINDQGEAAHYKNARTTIMLEILQDKQRSMAQEGRRSIKIKIKEAIAMFSLERLSAQWPQLIERKESIGYNAAFITHPRDNQTESFKFLSLHSEFIDLKGDLLQIKTKIPPTLVL